MRHACRFATNWDSAIPLSCEGTSWMSARYHNVSHYIPDVCEEADKIEASRFSGGLSASLVAASERRLRFVPCMARPMVVDLTLTRSGNLSRSRQISARSGESSLIRRSCRFPSTRRWKTYRMALAMASEPLLIRIWMSKLHLSQPHPESCVSLR